VSGTTTTAGGGGGSRNWPLLIVSGLVLVGVILAAAFLVFGGGGASPSPSPAATAVPTEAPTEVPTEAPTSAPTPTPEACAPGNVPTQVAGLLVVGADNPAYPPYFEPSDPNPLPWELGDPTNGKGFEGAVAAEIAKRLGFDSATTEWIVVPFNNSFAPGPKPFDFYITQVSFTEERATAVDMSDGYYFVNQSVVAMKGSPLIGTTSIAQLAPYKFGAQVGTTSYTTIIETIKPTQEPAVFDTNDAAIQALQNGQIDGLVVDLPTAFFITAAQIVDADFNPLAEVVGQFPAPPEGEYFSLVLGQDSPLTECVNKAIASMTSDGTLEAITKEWLADKVNAPEFTP
jgi:polar amino acid transport system substrate-binding protein